ncbi:MAG: EscU/YscU/HrcU family type III secretion system export apparatus switch protein [Firmicutes bacterium]|nr:EscU/YscU/HrcU family type III secretion system export apparatus switch protein [Bacillota bacterium]
MSRSRRTQLATQKAVALQYGADDLAPVVVASGMGYMAEKIVEAAADSGVPIYEDNSLATLLSQLRLGQEIPEDLYKAIVEIYVYFLHFDPSEKEKAEKEKTEKERAASNAAQTERRRE